MSTRKTTLFYVVLIAVASLAVSVVIASRLDLTPDSSAQTVAVPADEQRAARRVPSTRTTFRNIAKAAAPGRGEHPDAEARAADADLTEFFGGAREHDLLRRFFGGGAGWPAARTGHRRPSDRARDRRGRAPASSSTRPATS